MKVFKKLILTAVLSASLTGGMAKAATVSITGGFSGGVDLNIDGVLDNYIFQIGGWDGSTWTQFGTETISATAGDDIIGSFAGVGPASLNNSTIFIFVGSGPDFATSVSSGAYAILQTLGTFPADVSSALASSSASFTSSADVTISASSAGTSFTSGTVLNIVTVPEPSAALLSGLGVMLLLRRRRNKA